MTIDSVVQKTGLSLLVVLVAAFATWVMTPALGASGQHAVAERLSTSSTPRWRSAGLGAFGLSLVNSFKRVISPALVLAFAALEGVALGAFSKFFDYQYGGGIVIQAVIGTFAAFAGTLAAYKFFDIKVSNKFRMGVIGGHVRHGRPVAPELIVGVVRRRPRLLRLHRDRLRLLDPRPGARHLHADPRLRLRRERRPRRAARSASRGGRRSA